MVSKMFVVIAIVLIGTSAALPVVSNTIEKADSPGNEGPQCVASLKHTAMHAGTQTLQHIPLPGSVENLQRSNSSSEIVTYIEIGFGVLGAIGFICAMVYVCATRKQRAAAAAKYTDDKHVLAQQPTGCMSAAARLPVWLDQSTLDSTA
jgi:hypothetical protein